MTDKPLQGKWALILGASSGFGAATGTARWPRAGMNIAGVHLDLRATLPAAKAVIADIEAAGRPGALLQHQRRRSRPARQGAGRACARR